MRFALTPPARPASFLCPEGFVGPRGTRPLLDERRTVAEARTLLRDPIWRAENVPAGHGRPVLLIPGFMSGDVSMTVMARWLARAGYTPLRSQVRLNVDCSRATVDRLERRVAAAVEREGRPVTLIGQSLGGVFAKTVALRRPELVAGVITLGSPHLAPAAAHRLLMADVAVLTALSRAGLRNLMRTECVRGDCASSSWRELQGTFPAHVPFASVYSRSDGIVDWHACLDPAAEHIEVASSHCGMSMNPEVYRALAERLPAFAGPVAGEASPESTATAC
jgi:pimeloyl-ACP methyl ester carboxylesterase